MGNAPAPTPLCADEASSRIQAAMGSLNTSMAAPIRSLAQPDEPHDGERDSVRDVTLARWTGAGFEERRDTLAVEEPLEMQLGFGPTGDRQVKSISVTMRTPGDDLHLAVGFLLTEGVVREAEDIVSVAHVGEQAHAGAAGNVVRVELHPAVEVALATLQRNFYTTSSCGICGKASLLALQTVCPPRARSRFRIAPATVLLLPNKLLAAQTVFARTGGLHGAGLCSADGTLLAVCEDVGRHNAVDKLLGREFLAGTTPLRGRLLLLSGRCSFELMQKALMAGIPAVASVGAPSSLAVQVARQFNIALVGFIRGEQFNIYSGAEYIEAMGVTR